MGFRRGSIKQICLLMSESVKEITLNHFNLKCYTVKPLLSGLLWDRPSVQLIIEVVPLKEGSLYY